MTSFMPSGETFPQRNRVYIFLDFHGFQIWEALSWALIVFFLIDFFLALYFSWPPCKIFGKIPLTFWRFLLLFLLWSRFFFLEKKHFEILKKPELRSVNDSFLLKLTYPLECGLFESHFYSKLWFKVISPWSRIIYNAWPRHYKLLVSELMEELSQWMIFLRKTIFQ